VNKHKALYTLSNHCFLDTAGSMKIVQHSISNTELSEMAEKMFERLVKAVIDVEREIMVVDAAMHADEEFLLLEDGSEQHNLWGFNLHPDKYGIDDFIVFDSMINIRPRQGNRSRGVDNPEIQKRIRKIVHNLVIP
jgi:hypothetical protein